VIADLQQLMSALPASAAAAQPAGDGAGNGAGAAAQSDDEEVVDAEFTRD
jgi:molecular chaperone DnaK